VCKFRLLTLHEELGLVLTKILQKQPLNLFETNRKKCFHKINKDGNVCSDINALPNLLKMDLGTKTSRSHATLWLLASD
jgi:hypothetical protein